MTGDTPSGYPTLVWTFYRRGEEREGQWGRGGPWIHWLGVWLWWATAGFRVMAMMIGMIKVMTIVMMKGIMIVMMEAIF